MGDSRIDTVISASCTSKVHIITSSIFSTAATALQSRSLPHPATAFTNITGKSGESDTPLSPSHAGDKGYSNHFNRKNYANDVPDDLYATSSAVLNAFMADCFLKCRSFDHIGSFFIDSERATYSASPSAGTILCASLRNFSNCSFGTGFITNFNFKSCGLRLVDIAVLPRPSFTIPLSGMCNRHMPICKEEGKAAVSAPSNTQRRSEWLRGS